MSDQRTEEATPKRLREARQRGQVPKSRELAGALTLLAAAMALGASADGILAMHVATFELALEAAAGRLAASPGEVLEACVSLAALAIAPPIAAIVVVGTIAHVAQTGPLFAPEAISFSLEKLDPIAGAQGLFSGKRAVEMLKSAAILTIVGAVAYLTLRDGMRGTLSLTGRDAAASLAAGALLVRSLMLRVGGAMLAIAVLDVVYQRWRWMRDLRMTKEEVKREHKEAEGDPHTKQARERLRHEILAHGALEQVRKADVLVINPTHLAIALRFDEESEQAAPEVLAKGQDELAQRMIEAAREAGVPILRDVPLAQGLYELEIGEEIPEALYEAVAAVLRAAWAERGEAERGAAGSAGAR